MQLAQLNLFFLGIFALSIVSNFLLIAIVYKKIRPSTTTLTFLLYLSGTLIMGIGQLLSFISPEKTSFEFWNTILNFGYAFFPNMLLIFTLTFIGKQHLFKNYLFLVLILMPSFIFNYISSYTSNIEIIDFEKAKLFPWGYQVPQIGPWAPFFLIWIQFCFITSIVLLIRNYRKIQDAELKRPHLILILAVLIPFIGGALTSGILPQFGIRVYPIGIPLNLINNFLIAYAISRYGGSFVDPEAVASSVTQIMPGAVVVLNKKNQIILVNPFAEKFLGFSKNQILNKDISILYPEKEKFDLFKEKILLPLLVSPLVKGEESQITTASGEAIDVNVYAVNYKDEPSGLDAIILVFADIQKLKDQQEEIEKNLHQIASQNTKLHDTTTALSESLAESKKLQLELEKEKLGIEKKVEERTFELKEEQAKLQASINSLSYGFIIIDQNQFIVSANEASKSFFHLLSENTNLATIKDQLGPSLDLGKVVSDSMVQRKILKYEIESAGKFLRIILTPFTINPETNSLGCVILIEDITEEKTIQRSKDEFFTLASHELRTPLTAIRGYAWFLLKHFKENKTAVDPQVPEIVQHIQESSIRLISIVNDFIDTSSLEQKQMIFKKEEFELNELVKSVTDWYQLIAQQKQLYLKFEPLENNKKIIVKTDKDRLKQVLVNLIMNAVKYTTYGGVTVKLEVTGDSRIKIYVTDSGKGIKPHLQNLLFKKFQQAVDDIYTRDGTQQGVGLGLYISKLIMTGLGGEIKLESSEVDRGSTFSITLPKA